MFRSQEKLGWTCFCVCDAFFGFTAPSNISVTYAVDCYSDYAGEALVAIFVVRNIIALICKFYSDDWISGGGIDTLSSLLRSVAAVVNCRIVGYRHRSRHSVGCTGRCIFPLLPQPTNPRIHHNLWAHASFSEATSRLSFPKSWISTYLRNEMLSSTYCTCLALKTLLMI